MPRYRYKARNQEGAVITGYAEADNLEMLKSGLRSRGLWLVRWKEEKSLFNTLFRNNLEGLKNAELIMYASQMAVLLQAGIPLLTALGTIQENASQRAKYILAQIAGEIKSGKNYSEALGKFPGVFPGFFIGLMEVGEAGGMLAPMHERIAGYLQHNKDLKNKVLYASIYPLFVLGATLIGIYFILTIAFPKIADTYNKNNVELPILTQLMLDLSDFLLNYWYFPLAGLVLLVFVFFSMRLQEYSPIKKWLDRLVLKIPFYGPFLQSVFISRFSYNVGLLLKSGLPLLKGLEMTKNIINNLVLKGYINEIMSSVHQGEGITSYIKKNKFFPPILVSMIKTGEEAGSLAEMTIKASHYYDQEVEDRLKKFTALVEPIMILCAAGLVFLVLLAFYLPMFNMFKVISGH